jgi:hypothetical protein
MVTARYLKMAAVIGECARFHIFNPGTVNAQRDLVFTFAGGGASVAANAFTIVDDETVVFGGRAHGESGIFCHNILKETFAERNDALCKEWRWNIDYTSIMWVLPLNDNRLVLFLLNSCGIITKSLHSTSLLGETQRVWYPPDLPIER